MTQVMEKQNEEVEPYLREFRRRAIRELEAPRDRKVQFMHLTAAAAILLGGGILFWYAQRGTKGSTK